MARRLEDAGNAADFHAISTKLPEFTEALSRLLVNIRAVFPNDEEDAGRGPDGEALLRLKTALELKKYREADDIFAAIMDAVDNSAKKALSDISEYLLTSEYNKAAAAIDSILEKMG
jgi:hypothetical protein